MKNIKTLLFVTVVLMMLVTITGAYASSDNYTSTSSETQEVIEASSTSITPQTVATDNKIKENPKRDVKTHIVNNDSVDDIFAGEDYTLNDEINDGDILDFQGVISKNHSIKFNKAVNVTTSTHDANITLNTTAGNMFGSEPGNSFVVTTGASYSNFTGLYLYNTQFWVTNTTHVVFDNMSMVVEDKQVGSGVGQTSIRENSSYITLKNSYIYTKNNGGSSSLVLAYANYCTLDNNTIVGEGTVGNLIYLTTYNVAIPSDQLANCHNNITNNRVIGPSTKQSICYALAITGYDNLVENNTFSYVGNGLMEQWGSGTSVWEDPGVPTFYNKIIGNTFNLGCGIDGQFKNVSFINNVINDNGKMNIYDNTTFINNTVTGNLTIYTPINITNENLHNVIFNVNSSNSNLTNNNISGVILINQGQKNPGQNITIANNTINNEENYTISVKTSGNTIVNNTLIAGTTAGESTVIMITGNILEDNKPEPATDVILTDENYYTYFNDDSTANTDMIQNFSKIYLTGDFYNKNFIFSNIVTNLFNNQSTLYNTTITLNDNSKLSISNLNINNGADNENALVINSDKNTVKNLIINQNTSQTSPTIIVNGDSNTLAYNTININSDSATETTAIKVSSNKNTINNNNINITSSNDITAIIIDSQDKTADENIILSNTINVNTTTNTNSIIIGENTNKNNISGNTLNINSANATAFTTTSKTTSNNVIERNNININTTDSACAINITTTEETNCDYITVYMNTVKINSDKTYGIIFNDQYKKIKASNISNNGIYANSTTITGLSITGDNVYLHSSLYLISLVDEDKYNVDDNIAVVVNNSQNLTVRALTLVLTKTHYVILNNVSDSNITWIQTTEPGTSVPTEEIPLTVINSENNIIHQNRMNTTKNASINLINSSNNRIYENNMVAHYPLSGDFAVAQDENSHDNIIENNTPNRAFLTDENYNDFFDENNVFNASNIDVIIIASDLHEKDMIITVPIKIENPENNTIYNSTITINATNTVTLENLTINNTDERENSLNLLTRTEISGCNIYQEGNNKNMIYTTNYTTMENSNLELNGNNNNMINNNIGQLSITYNNMTTMGINTTTIKSSNSTKSNSLQYNNIIADSENSITIDLFNTRINNLRYNNITITSQNTTAIKDVMMTTRGTMSYNNITTNSNTTTVILDDVNINFNNNKILVNNTLVDTPIILVTTTKGGVSYNYLESYNTVGNDAVETPGSKEGNIPTTKGYDSNITIDAPEELSQYKTVTIGVTVTDAFDRPIEGTLTVTANGEEIPVEDGIITYTPTSTSDVTITAKYQDPTGKYNTTTQSVTLPVKEATTTVELEPVAVTLGDVATITATVVDQDGDAVSAGRVAFKVNGKVLRDSNNKVIYASVEDGTATMTYEDTSKWDNDTTIQVIYVGSSTQPNSESEVVNPTVTVPEEEEPEFAVSDATATAGEEVTITVTTKNLDSGKVVLKVNGKTVKAGDGKLYAKVEGDTTTFTYTVPKTLKAGDYTIKAVYTGGTNKLESEAKLTIE
ncbi:MAG: hypothetical protein BZ136_09335 [Methanosphaera sp. rholeuAM74]|nr:MAG: hypothetical protein BZ136_09335 [Methanosphaera sp. rholeuAM74]